MRKYQPGDKSKAVCWHCEVLVETTFALRNAPFSDGSGMAHDALAVVCDICGNVVAMAPQIFHPKSE